MECTFIAVAYSKHNGFPVMKAILDLLRNGPEITERVFIAVAGNLSCGQELTDMLL
jgi:hypothetical protein